MNGLCHRTLPTDSPQLNSMFPGSTVHQRVPCPRHAPFPGAVNIKWLAEVGTQRPSLLTSIEDISGGFRAPYDRSQGLCCKHIRVHLTQPCSASLTFLRVLPEKWPADTDLYFNVCFLERQPLRVQIANTFPFPSTTQNGRLFANFMTMRFKIILEISMSITVQIHSNGFVYL